jgi:signal transduction histidine kinase
MPLMNTRQPPDRPWAWPGFVPWLILGYGLLGLATLALGQDGRSLALSLLNTAVFTHAGILSLGRSRREPAARLGWRSMALGLFARAFHQGLASLALLRHGAPPPFPSLGDLLVALSVGCMALSLLAWPLISSRGSERLRLGMDGLGAALSALFMAWYVAFGPLFHRSGSSPAERGTLVVLFLGHATILGTCVYLGARKLARFRGPLGWITAGFVLLVLQISRLIPLALAGRSALGAPLDLLVLLAALALLLAPLAPLALEPGPPPSSEVRDHSTATLILPILPAAAAWAVFILALVWSPVRLDAPILGLASAMAILGLYRGYLTLKDFQRLSSVLESRILERTRDLEALQGAMLRTERMNAMAVLGAGMAHDLNNALATVRACAELALMRMEEGQAPEVKDLDHILVAADQSAKLTQRLMAFGRTEGEASGSLCMREELSHLETILRMLLGRQISLRLELGEGRVPVQGSRAQIEQIFVNLVANARDAMPTGGAIVIRLARATVAGKPIARVEVEDNGEGMTPEVQANIFSPFYTTKGPGRGTGLGLASVRQLMQDLGGNLSVASQPSQGTTFVLRLPLLVG